MFNRDDYNNQVAQFRDFEDDAKNDNPVNQVLQTIQKREVKKTQQLASTNMTDPSAVMMYNLIKTAGVNADAYKTLIKLLNNKQHYDQSLLKNMTPALKSGRAEILALLMNAFTKFIKDNLKIDDPQRDQKIKDLDDAFDKTAGEIFRKMPFIPISSLAQEYHAQICDGNTNPYKLNEIMSDRYKIIGQQLNHQISPSYSYPHNTICFMHNWMSPCFKKDKCPMDHVCAICGKYGHIATDPICPKSQLPGVIL